MSSQSNEEAATELLSRLSPLADDPILGLETWYTEFTSVDDDSLRTRLLTILPKVIEYGCVLSPDLLS
jgi:hypothetical protein